MNEPKKETVRITLPPRPSVNPGGVPVIKKETVRINLPARPVLRTTPPVDPATKKETNRVPAVKPPTLAPKPFAASPAPAGLRPPPTSAFSAPAVPRPPGSAPVVPTPPRSPGALPMAPRPPGPPATAPVPRAPGVGVPLPPGAAPGVPAAPRPPIITGKAPPAASPTSAVPVPLAARPAFPPADDALPVPAVPVLKPAGLPKEIARVEAPPAPRTGPAPTFRATDRTPPAASAPVSSLTPTLVPVAATMGEGDPVPAGGTLPLWAYLVIFVLALLTFGVQLAAYLAPVAE